MTPANSADLPQLLCRLIFTLVALSAPVAFAQSPASLPADYLTPNLRAQVEKLKVARVDEPANRTNLPERARVLWEWANAYALNGGYLPVNLTQDVSAVFAYQDIAARSPDLLDNYIFEMTLRDEEPDAIGSLVTDLGPFEARTHVTLRQIYTVGSRQIQTGGGLIVARHFMPNYGQWQVTDSRADNYISIHSSNGKVNFVATTAPIRGMHGNFRGVANVLMFKVASGTLQPGDQVTITYGDTSAGSRGFLMADFSSDRMPLPLYLVLNEGGVPLSLPIAPVVVTGTIFSGLRGFAPSILNPGERFSLSVRAEDRYRNRARDGHPLLQLKLGEEVIRTIPASEQAISIVDDLTLETPGVYRFVISTMDGGIVGDVNPILVSQTPRQRIYWGDTHGHSGFAEGIGTPDRFMQWARDDARLDYVTHSEHDVWMDDYEWAVLQNNVRRYSKDGEFIAYLGYEWTVRNIQGGHHNVLFRTPDRRERVAAQFFPTLSSLYQGLRAGNDTRDVLIIPHAHQAGDYRQSDPDQEPLIEIMSQHGNFEWFGQAYLDHGHQVGFVAASDNHLSQPGYTAPNNSSLAQRGGLGAVFAEEKTTDALFDAMKARQTYATSGERMIIDFSVNNTMMGQRAAFAEKRQIRGRVIGTAPIDSITLLKNGEEIWQQDYLSETSERLAGTQSLLLSFGSDSIPYHPGDNPRGWRHWRGTLEIDNATLLQVQGQDFHNENVQSLQVDAENPDLVHFTTMSRGDTSSILLQLEGLKRATAVTITLDAARETGSGPPMYRQPQETPAASLTLKIADMEQGKVGSELPLPGYIDSISLRRIIEEGTLDVAFSVEDTGDRQGDYYFIRVKQADDALAWTSPIWIGGYPPR